MSLIVSANYRDPVTGKLVEVPEKPSDPQNQLFGFEVWAKGLWGSPLIARRLSLKKLPRVGEGLPVMYLAEDLDSLEEDARKILGNLDWVANTGSAFTEHVEFRCKNLIEAIRIARTVPDSRGAVWIS